MKKLIAAFAFSFLPACVVPIPVPVGSPVGPVSNEPVQATSAFTSGINSFRASQGLGPLQQSPTLTRAATLHAKDMVARGYFSHKSPGGPNGDDLMDRARAAGCATRFAAENIAEGQGSEDAVLTSWANSPGHRANMLQPRFNSYGLGREGDTWVLLLSNGC